LSLLKTAGLTALAMFAFAANSILCRFALANDAIDPGLFATVRIVSGAAMLWLIYWLLRRRAPLGGSTLERARCCCSAPYKSRW
jgi:drug/metabolite transporter (DMT)-like permease